MLEEEFGGKEGSFRSCPSGFTCIFHVSLQATHLISMSRDNISIVPVMVGR
jgi:hypothetical protein